MYIDINVVVIQKTIENRSNHLKIQFKNVGLKTMNFKIIIHLKKLTYNKMNTIIFRPKSSELQNF